MRKAFPFPNGRRRDRTGPLAMMITSQITGPLPPPHKPDKMVRVSTGSRGCYCWLALHIIPQLSYRYSMYEDTRGRARFNMHPGQIKNDLKV